MWKAAADAEGAFYAVQADNVVMMAQQDAAQLAGPDSITITTTGAAAIGKQQKGGLLPMGSLMVEIDADASSCDGEEDAPPAAAAAAAADDAAEDIDLDLLATEGGMDVAFEDFEDLRMFLIALLSAKQQLRHAAVNAGMLLAAALLFCLIMLLSMPPQRGMLAIGAA